MESFGTNFILFSAFVLIVSVTGITLFSTYSAKMAREMNELTTSELESNYQEALQFFAEHPGDPTAKSACMDHGRAYYEFTIPEVLVSNIDTPFTNSGAPDAGRDAKIKADMDARLTPLRAAS